jgi:predicted PurR-regulated permease PerM
MESKPKSNFAKEIAYYFFLMAAAAWLLVRYQVLIGPLIISGLISYLLYPLVTWLSKRFRTDRRRIAGLVYLVFLAVLIWGIVFIIPLAVEQANLISSQISSFEDQVASLQIDIVETLGFDIPINSYVEELGEDLGQLLQPERSFRVIRSATTNIVWVLVILITSYHLLRDWEKLREWFFGLFPDEAALEYRKLHQEIKKVWRSYLRGQVLVMMFIGLMSGLGAAAIGLPNALILGVLAGALALIPNIGPAAATIIASLVAWTQGSTFLDLSNLSVTLLVVAIFGLVQMIEGFWLTPRIMSRRLHIHPAVITIAIVGTLFALGALIALIIVPIIGSLILVLQYVRRKRAGLDPWLDEKPSAIGEDSPPEPTP